MFDKMFDIWLECIHNFNLIKVWIILFCPVTWPLSQNIFEPFLDALSAKAYFATLSYCNFRRMKEPWGDLWELKATWPS